MKKTLLVALILLVVSSLMNVLFITRYYNLKTEEVKYAEVLTPGVTLRDGIKGAKVGVVPEGNKVKIVGRHVDYYIVEYKTNTGYAWAEQLKVDD